MGHGTLDGSHSASVHRARSDVEEYSAALAGEVRIVAMYKRSRIKAPWRGCTTRLALIRPTSHTIPTAGYRKYSLCDWDNAANHVPYIVLCYGRQCLCSSNARRRCFSNVH